jgi:pyrroline-5-carboxylate reductase
MSTFPDAKILLIGAGKMGSALLAAWLKEGALPQSLTVVETNPVTVKKLAAENIQVVISAEAITEKPDCIVLAVKPQSMDEVISSFRRKPESQAGSPLILSIAAGKTLAYFETHLGKSPVVRAMPNTPALIGKGISALCANAMASDAQRQLAQALLGAAGETVWLDDESKMDAVTAISGSGPAYVFLFMEALIEAGRAQGLPEETARKLVLATVRGSAKLARKSADSLEQLRKNVTSPGGTTEAALKVLMKDDALKALIHEAVAEAVKRSRELA